MTPYSPENQTGESPVRKEKGVINQTILPLVPEGATPINEILSVWRDDSRWTYFIGSHPVYSHACDDLRMFRLTAAQLIDTGNCRACEIIKTFGVSKSSIDRAVRRYREEGAEAFFRQRSRRGIGTVMTPEVIRQAQKMLYEYDSRRTVADELELPYSTLVKAIQDGRLYEPSGSIPGGTTKSYRNIKDAEAADQALTKLFEQLNAAEITYPGTNLRLVYDFVGSAKQKMVSI